MAASAAAGATSFSRARLQGLSVFGLRIAGAGLALAAQVFASRLLGPEEFGRYSLLLVWVLVFGYAAMAGSGQIVCRYLAQYVKAGDSALAAGLLRTILGVVLGIAALLALFAIAVIGLGFTDLETRHVLLAVIAFACIPLIAAQDYLESIARGLDKPTLGIGPSFILRHLAIIAGLLTLMAMGANADALTVMIFTAAGLVISICVQYVLLASHLRATLDGAVPRYDVRQWFTAGLPMAASDTVEILLLNADILILGLLMSPEYVALYFAATRVAQILFYVPYAATAATAQKYAALTAASERAELQTLIGKTATVSVGLTIAGAAVLSLLAPYLLNLFGAEYVEAAPLVALLALGIVLAGLFGPGEDVLNMLGQERLCSLGFVLALVVNVALNFTLIPLMGLTGAAVATMTAMAVRGALLSYFAWRRLGLVVPAGLALIVNSSPRDFAHEA